MAKIKYINLINDFWAADAVRHFDPVATRIYFEVLGRLNANRWEPVAIPKRHWLATVYDRSHNILQTLKQLQDAGLLRVVSQRGKATWYSVPGMEHETAEKVGEIIPQSGGNNPTVETAVGEIIPQSGGNNPTVETAVGEIIPQSGGNNPTVTPYILNKDIDILHDDARAREERLIEEFKAAQYDTARMAIADAVGIPPQDIPYHYEDFAQHCRAMGRNHSDITDLRAHFYSWLKIHINGQNQRPSAAGYATSQPTGTKQPARTVEGVIAALAAKSDSSGFGTL